MSKYIADKALLNFTKILNTILEMLAYLYGNYTSQFFANIYMNELDHYVKRILKVKYYVRYMDDFILLLDTKKECIDIKKEIKSFLKETLHLELNSKSRYCPCQMGVNFCGYRTFCTHRLLRTSSKIKIKNNLKRWNKLYKSNKLPINFAMQSLNSWLGHTSHCNAYKLQQKVLHSCEFLYFDDVDYNKY